MNLRAGVDLGGTKIQTVVLRDGDVVGQGRTLTPHTNAHDVVVAIGDTLQLAAQDAGVSLDEIEAIGVGSPGTVSPDGTTVSHASNVPGFDKGFPLGTELSQALGGKPVRLDNDVRVAASGEHLAGAGRPFRNLLAVFLGTGVGGGLILEGKLRHGRGAAGEIGHTVVKDRGRECGCGKRGCLEAYASRGRIEWQARRLVEKGSKTIVFDLMKARKREHLTGGVVVAALEAKDKMIVRLMDEAVWALGIALASSQNLLDLEAIIIGGGLGDKLGKPFVERVARAMQPHLHVRENPPAMLTTELGDLSGAVGAALLAG